LVNFTKWAVIAGALVFLGLFTQEAAASGLTGTLSRTGLSGQAIGTGISAAGTGAGLGIAGFFKGILSPFWEIRNIVRGFMNLGSATPWLEDTPSGQGGGTDSTTSGGGGEPGTPVPIPNSTPDIYTGGGFTYYNDRTISPSPVTDVTVTWPGGQTTDLPLSAEAVKYYQDIGVQISNDDGGGSNEFSGGGGGIAITNTGWGHNVSTPSGGVASGNLSLRSWGA
jgi:hypothetical protein